MDENKVLFRNKGRGYNKDDVNEYIAAENKRFADTEAGYKRTLQEKERVVEGFSNELYKCNNENYILKNSLAEKDKIIDTYKTKMDDAEKTISELRQRISELEASKAAAPEAAPEPVPAPAPDPIPEPEPEPAPAPIPSTVFTEAPEPVADPEPEPAPEVVPDPVPEEPVRTVISTTEPAIIADEEPVVEEETESESAPCCKYDDEIIKKAEAYDLICDQVDEILDHARKEAEKIISAAQEEARKIRSSKKEVDAMKRDITGRSNGIIGDIRKNIVCKKH